MATRMGTGMGVDTSMGRDMGAVGLMGNAAKGQRGYWGTRPCGNGPNGDGLVGATGHADLVAMDLMVIG